MGYNEIQFHNVGPSDEEFWKVIQEDVLPHLTRLNPAVLMAAAAEWP